MLRKVQQLAYGEAGNRDKIQDFNTIAQALKVLSEKCINSSRMTEFVLKFLTYSKCRSQDHSGQIWHL
jgi:hypothetical protein